jgi:hypothetical protein
MMPNEDNSLQEPRDTLGRAHGFANMTILCAREQIRIVEEPDVGTIPHFLSWVGGLLLHGTYCVEGFLGRSDAVLCPNNSCQYQKAVEMLFHTTLQTINIMLHLVKKRVPVRATPSFRLSYFHFYASG